MIPQAESKPRPSGPADRASGEGREVGCPATRTDVSTQASGPGLPCVWMSAGVLAFKLCDRDFECERCPLDLALGAARAPRAPERAPRARVEFPNDRAYSAGHGWVLPLGAARVRTGLDALAARLVERVHGLVLPAAGTHAKAGQPLVWLIDDHEAVPVSAPVDGVVLASNPSVRDDPGLALRDPYGAGWLVELARDEGTSTRLTDATLARHRAARDLWELRRLAARHDSSVGRTARDGGRPIRDLRRVLGARRYQRLLRRWLG